MNHSNGWGVVDGSDEVRCWSCCDTFRKKGGRGNAWRLNMLQKDSVRAEERV